MRDRKIKIDDRVMVCMDRGLEACELTAQAKAWEDDILWKWLFSDNAENVLGGIITLMWRAGDGTVANHAVSFYRCQKEGDVHIYVCNTWGEPCTENKIKPKEFIGQFITLHKINNLLIALDNIKQTPYTIRKGQRLAQICSPRLSPIFFSIVESLSETERGSGGFGSTGR